MSKNEYLNQFVEYLYSQETRPSKATVKNYKADIGQFIRWFETKYQRDFEPQDTSYQVIEIYKQDKASGDISQRSIERHLSSLRKFFTFLKMEGHVSNSPFDQQLADAKKHEVDPYRIKDFKNYLYVYNASKLTIKNYLIDVKQFLKWAEEVLVSEDSWNVNDKNIFNKLNSQVIEEYKQRLIDQHFSPLTVNRKLSSLRKFFTWATEENLLLGSKFYVQNTKTNEKAILQAQALEELKNQQTEKQTAKDILEPKDYSRIPPVRMFQKIGKSLNFVFDKTFIFPLASNIKKGEYLLWKLKGKPVFESLNLPNLGIKNAKNALNSGFQILNTRKEFYAPLAVSTIHWPWHKKTIHHLRYTRPNWYRKYHSYAITHYFHFAVLIIIMSAIGFGFYSEFFVGPQLRNPALAVLPTAPPRILSFQGRLTDNSDNPVTSSTAMRFAIYNDLTASDAALLWQEIDTIAPDPDGIFSILLGNNTVIPSTLFTENAGLYLGVTVTTTPELTPRQQLATVAYATNSETLQGLLPITAAAAGTENVVLALDSGGDLSIGGSATPTFQATGGQFTISGNVLNLTTVSGTDTNVIINPDGMGKIDLQKPLQNTSNNNNISSAMGAVEVDDRFAILATSSGQSAFTINQNGSGDLISASAGGVPKFTVGNSGNVGIGTTALTYGLNVNGTANFASAIYANGDVGANGYLLTSSAGSANTWTDPGTITGSGWWQRNSGALSTKNITDDLLLGAAATSSALVKLTGTSGNDSWINTGNVGIGTTSPGKKFEVALSSSPYLILNSSGNVAGFGTSSDGWGTRISDGNFTTFGKDLILSAGNVNEVNTNLIFKTINTVAGSTEKMRIDTSGNVGIGTTDPGSYRLNVNGDTLVNNLYFANPGVGNSSVLQFLKTNDEAWIDVTETASDATTYGFYMADNPDSTTDKFLWQIQDWKGDGGDWTPLEFVNLNANLRAANVNAYGDYNIYGPWYSGGGQPDTVTETKSGTLSITPDVSGFTGTDYRLYTIQIDGTGSPNTFKWDVNCHPDYCAFSSSGVSITGSAQTLDSGVTITFSGTTGGVIDDTYQFRVYRGGHVLASDGSVTAPTFSFTSDPNTGMYRIGSDLLGFAANGTNGIAINSSGNVGIGTTDPGYKLEVNGTANFVSAIYANGDVGANGYLLTSSAGSANTWTDPGTITGSGWWQRNSLALSPKNITDDLLLGATATASALVKLTGTSGNDSWINTGNVGIGTTNPGQKLHVNGGLIQIDSASGESYISSSYWDTYATNYSFNTHDAYNMSFNAQGTGNFYFLGAGLTLVSILNNGNVGIGTTSPIGLLNVEGAPAGKALTVLNYTSADQNILTASTSGVTKFNLTNAGVVQASSFYDLDNTSYYLDPAAVGTSLTTVGSVGIGTTSPLTATGIHINKNSLGNAAMVINQLSTATGADLFVASKSGITQFRMESDGDIIVGPGGAGKITAAVIDPYLISNDGSIQPSLTFRNTVTGGANDFFFQVDTTDLFTIKEGGNIGIGTTDPQFMLQVAGDIGPSSAGDRNIGSVALPFNTIYVNNIVGSGALGYWQRNLGALVPTNITDDLLLGSNASSSALFSVTGIASNQPVASVSGNLVVYPRNGWGGYAQLGDNLKLSPNGNTLVLTDPETGWAAQLSASDIFSSGIIYAGGSDGGTGEIVPGWNNQTGYVRVSGGNSSGTPNGGQIKLFGPNHATNPSEILLSGGNVGIGTTNPSSKLEINQSILGGTNLVLTTGAGNTDALTPLRVKSVNNGGYYEPILETPAALRISSTQPGSTSNQFRLLPYEGDIYFQNTNSAGDIYFSGLNGADADQINFLSASAYVKGYLGIGTDTTPDYMLAVYDENTSDHTQAAFLSGSGSTGKRNQILVGYGASSENSTVIGHNFVNAGGGDFGYLGTYDYENTLVMQTGNVGIGTTAPLAKLDVNGTASVGGTLTFYSGNTIQTTGMNTLVLGGSTTGNIVLNPSNAAAGGAILPNTNNVTDIGSSSLQFRNIYASSFIGGTSGIQGYWQRNSSALSPTNITDDLLLGATATASALVKLPGISGGNVIFNSGGNVGIGTTNPSDLLALVQTSTTGSAFDVSRNLAATSTDSPLVNLVQDNATDDQNALSIQNDGTGYGLGIANNSTGMGLRVTQGSGATGFGLNVWSNVDGTANSSLAQFYAGNAAFDQDVVHIGNYGVGYGLHVMNDSTGIGLRVEQGAAATGYGLNVYSNVDASATTALARVTVGNTAFDQSALYLDNYGTGNALQIDNRGTGTGVRVDQTGTGYGMSIYTNVGATANSPLVDLTSDNTGFDQTLLRLQQDGAADIVNVFDGATEVFTILDGGNVGIGTTAPLALLDVAGTATIGGQLTFDAGNTIQTTGMNTLVLGGNTTGNIVLNPSNAAAGGAILPNTNNVTDIGSSSLQFRNIYAQSFIGGTSGIQGYWQRNSSALSPTNITDDLLLGATATASALVKLPGISGGNVIFNSGGNVGIGTTGPLNSLEVAGTGARITGAYTEGTTNTGIHLGIISGTPRIGFFNGTAAQNWQIDNNAGTFRWYLPGVEHMTLTATTLSLPSKVISVTGTGNNYFAGNVGIGTTTPLSKLHVFVSTPTGAAAPQLASDAGLIIDDGDAPNIQFRGNNTSIQRIFFGDDDADAAVFQYDHTLNTFDILGAGGAKRVTIEQAGNVGIGTTAPLAKLDVNGTASVGGTLTFYSGNTIQTTGMNTLVLGGSTTGNIVLNPSNAAAGGAILPNTNNVTDIGSSSLQFRNIYAQSFIGGTSGIQGYWQRNSSALSPTNITDDLLLGATATASALVKLTGTSGNDSWINTGNVGIGTTAPTAKLVVDNTSDYNVVFKRNNVAAVTFGLNNGWQALSFSGNTYIDTGFGSNEFQFNSNMTYGNQDNTYTNFYLKHFGDIGAGAGVAKYVQFQLATDGYYYLTRQDTNVLGFSVNMPMNITGNVGIGTTSPIGLLNVEGDPAGKALTVLNYTSTDQNILTASTSGVTKFNLTNAGVVQASSFYDLDNTSYYLDPAATGVSLKISGDASASGSLVLQGSNYSTLDVLNNKRFDIQTSPSGDAGLTPRLSILNNGNVGIGTTGPTTKLHVLDTTSGSTNVVTIQNNVDLVATDTKNLLLLKYDSGATDTNGLTGIKWAESGYADRGVAIYQISEAGWSTNNSLGFFTNTGSTLTEKMRITSGGNVGIGTTDPGAYKLNVNGTANFVSAIYANGDVGANGYLLTSSAGSANTWTDPGTITGSGWWQRNSGALSPKNITDDLLLGATATASALVKLTGTSGNDSWINTGNVGIGTTAPGAKLEVITTGTTTNGANITANSLTTGTALYLASTSTGLTTGSLLGLDWSPGSATTATGDLFSINIGVNGTIGNLFNIKDNGSSLFSVSETAVTSNLPANFTSSGDVSMAYDLVFTNPTASYIKSSAPLYIEAGETFNSSDLTLRTFNKGNTIIDSEAFVTNYSATVSSQLVVGTNTAPANIGGLYLTNSSTFGKALAILNQTESQDIFTASASGTTRFVITNSGNVGIQTANPARALDVTGAINFTGALYVNGANGTGAQCLTGGATPAWGTCGSGGGASFWQELAGAVSPINIDADLLLGGTATSSALVKLTGTAGNNSWINTGNVGIGTSVPLSKFHVKGELRVGNTSGEGGDFDNYFVKIQSFYHANSLKILGETDIEFFGVYDYTNTALGLSGNVGIGTTNPTSLLHIYSSAENAATFSGLSGSDSTITLGGNTAGRIGEQYITYQNVTTATSGWLVGMGDDEEFYFDYATVGEIDEATPIVKITQAGNVGIGTTNPGAKLEIAGTLTVSGSNLTTLGGNLTVTGTAWTATPTISGAVTMTSGFDSNAASTVTALTIDGNTGTALNISGTSFVTDINLQNSETIDNDTDGRIKFTGDTLVSGNTYFANATTYYVNTSGTSYLNAGTFVSTLAVNSTAANALDIAGGIYAGTADAFKVDTSGNISSTGTTGLTLSGSGADISFSDAGATYNQISTGGTSHLALMPAGNVGIGTTNPIYPLDVSGAINTSTAVNLYHWEALSMSGASSDHLIIGNNSGWTQVNFPYGNVGIGTTNPGSKLQVIGIIQGSSFYDYENTNYFLDPAAVGTSLAVDGSISSGATSALAKTAYYADKNSLGNSLMVLNQQGSGNLIAASASGAIKFLVKNNGDVVVGPGGTGKLTALTLDPLYTIDGTRYSTYAPSMVGVKEEVTGKITLLYDPEKQAYAHTVFLNNQAVGSDLWLFSRVTDINIDLMSVLLTPDTSAKAWYEKNTTDRSITFYSDLPTSLSYRLTAPRFDHANHVNLSDETDPTITGLIVPPPPSTDGLPVASIVSSSSGNLTNGQFAIDINFDEFRKPIYQLIDILGNTIKKTGSYSELLAANINAGLINAQEASFDSLILATGNITIAGDSLQNYIAGIVEDILNSRNITTTSPIASIDRIRTNIISPLSENSNIEVALNGKDSKFEVKNSSNSAVAVIDSSGNASFSGKLSANDASISGTLRAGKIIADQIEGLNINASKSAQYITNNYYVSSESAIDNDETASDSAASNYLTMDNGFVDIASFSGQLGYVENLSAAYGKFTQGLMAFGPSSFADVSIAGQFSIGGQMIFADNSINVLGADLQIQPFRQGGINFLSGLLTIDSSGNLTAAGNATFKKTLFANIISPIPNQDLIIRLDSGLLENSTAYANNPKFEIRNSSNSAVLTVNQKGDLIASGAGTFGKLNLSLVAPAFALSNTEVLATGSAGVATISARQTELTINNKLVTDKSLIYITPKIDTDNLVIYLLRQVPGISFTVGINSISEKPIPFNWMIVN